MKKNSSYVSHGMPNFYLCKFLEKFKTGRGKKKSPKDKSFRQSPWNFCEMPFHEIAYTLQFFLNILTFLFLSFYFPAKTHGQRKTEVPLLCMTHLLQIPIYSNQCDKQVQQLHSVFKIATHFPFENHSRTHLVSFLNSQDFPHYLTN